MGPAAVEARPISVGSKPTRNFANFPLSLVSAVNLDETFNLATSQPPSALPTIQKCSIARSRQDGKQSPSDVAPVTTTPANRAIRSLSVTRSTGKLTSERRRRLHDNASTDLRPCSTIFKRNYAMLGVVFGAGFAFEMCVHPPAPNTPETIAETTGRMRC